MRDVISRVKATHRAHVGDLRTELLDPPGVKALHRQGNESFNVGALMSSPRTSMARPLGLDTMLL